MGESLGYLLTWRTYGTWLHGDPRGAVDHAHAQFGEPLLAASAVRMQQASTRMMHAPVELTCAARTLVADTLTRHCRIRGWECHELSVRVNHVHIVIAHAGLKPEFMAGQFKAYATRALRRGGHARDKAPLWAEGASTQYLWTAHQINGACDYVRDGQDTPR